MTIIVIFLFIFQNCVIKFIESTAKQVKCKLEVLRTLLEHNSIKENVIKAISLLEKSVELRLKRQPNKCKECLINQTDHCDHCTVGVLFSGGLDCTILAVLADKYLSKDQSIDLINVAFKKDENGSYEVPDRITGRQSLLELQKLCPMRYFFYIALLYLEAIIYILTNFIPFRQWVFREIDVPKDELEKYQENIIGDLVYPRQTILDESLGTALWFAARAQDNMGSSTSRVNISCM